MACHSSLPYLPGHGNVPRADDVRRQLKPVRPREQWQERAAIEVDEQRVPQRPHVGRQQRELQPEHAAVKQMRA